MRNVLVIAPHPDDETLGCGGTLLKHKQQKTECHWLIVTSAYERQGYTSDWISARGEEINRISEIYGFSSVTKLECPTAELDTLPKKDLVSKISSVVMSLKPELIYLPFWGDIHSDHGIVFDAAAACTKSFRFPFVRAVRVYETLSETEFALKNTAGTFVPNYFVDISDFLEEKLEIMSNYASEVMAHNGPRSLNSIRALATYRGGSIGSAAAEAFITLREIA